MSKPNEPVEKRSESEAEYYSWLAKQQGQATEIQSEAPADEPRRRSLGDEDLNIFSSAIDEMSVEDFQEMIDTSARKLELFSESAPDTKQEDVGQAETRPVGAGAPAGLAICDQGIQRPAELVTTKATSVTWEGINVSSQQQQQQQPVSQSVAGPGPGRSSLQATQHTDSTGHRHKRSVRGSLRNIRPQGMEEYKGPAQQAPRDWNSRANPSQDETQRGKVNECVTIVKPLKLEVEDSGTVLDPSTCVSEVVQASCVIGLVSARADPEWNPARSADWNRVVGEQAPLGRLVIIASDDEQEVQVLSQKPSSMNNMNCMASLLGRPADDTISSASQMSATSQMSSASQMSQLSEQMSQLSDGGLFQALRGLAVASPMDV